MRNNQQGVLYFTAPFKAEILSTAPSNTSSNDFFVSLHHTCLCRCYALCNLFVFSRGG